MKSFTEDNHYFIRNFSSQVKGFTIHDRFVNYNNKLKKETRERLLKHYKKLESRFQKKEFYSEALDLLKEFEFEYLILSIYFDEDAEYLLKELSSKLQTPVPNYIDKYQLLELVENLSLTQFSLKSFHVKYFRKTIALDIPTEPSKNNTINPESTTISKWLSVTLQQTNREIEIMQILLHFHRYWQLNFCEPFNYTKGIVILEKVNGSLKQIKPDQLKTNPFTALIELKRLLQEILPTTIPCPFSDNVDNAKTRDQNVKNGYLIKINEFNNILEQFALYFHDFSTIGLREIVEKYCTSSEGLKSILMPNILERFKQGLLPTNEEVAWIRDIRLAPMIIKDKMNLELYQQITKHNYIF